ncbi:MAG TPA: DUF6576 domain-containing protein [Opitutales bacterium]|jgi:hypothetical protein|nr:DUF6576 domain-containing protein [Opitutales bacterium]
MRFYPGDPDHQPIRYFGRVPVFAATILAALYCGGMLFTTVCSAAGISVMPWALNADTFYRHFHLWQVLTYSFINSPDFYFLFGVFFLYRFSAEIEQYFGRRAFLKLFAANLLVPALVLGVWALFGRPAFYTGMYELSAAQFIAYSTLYPNLEFFGWVPMKYVAFACLAISGLSYVSYRDWVGLSILTAECAVSFGFIRYLKRGGSIELGDWVGKLNPFRRRRFRVLPTPAQASIRSSGGPANMESVDAILDKIARSGFASLTIDEKDQLERARDVINRKRS